MTTNDQVEALGTGLLAEVSDELLASAMRAAVAAAGAAAKPFAAALVDVAAGTVALCEANSTTAGIDPFGHAEMNVLRAAVLSGRDMRSHLLVSTAEPCPMCAAAAVLSRIGGIVYGTAITTLADLGWRQILLPVSEVTSRSTEQEIGVRGGVLTELTDSLYQTRSTTGRR